MGDKASGESRRENLHLMDRLMSLMRTVGMIISGKFCHGENKINLFRGKRQKKY